MAVSFTPCWSIAHSGSLWFTGRTLFYLFFRGFYHIRIQKDRNNVAYKWLHSPYTKRKLGCGGAAPII